MVSALELFTIGIGPSSSHTVGPMRAAHRFATRLVDSQLDVSVASITVDLYGSLGATGRGHGTHRAIILGLEGELPDLVDPDVVAARIETVRATKTLHVAGARPIAFHERAHLRFHRRETLPFHPNGLRFRARDTDGEELLQATYYSTGGGFIVDHGEDGTVVLRADDRPLPFPFHTGAQLLEMCRDSGQSVAEMVAVNEQAWHSPEDLSAGLQAVWAAMRACVARGCTRGGTLPGGLKVRRRAADLKASLDGEPSSGALAAMDWVSLYALAVNEENAAGGRVVTAPTNGAAGIIPAVLHYYWNFIEGSSRVGVEDFLLTAAAVGNIIKKNASISGAEVGCQGEVGSACSMAAAGLTAVLGGSPEQIENAAEIGVEHNLGLTCDPVGGLVQIPCIERNAIGAVKAINAAQMAMHGDGAHHVSLDVALKTMRDTGADMLTKYKETARGGLAVNVVEC